MKNLLFLFFISFTPYSFGEETSIEKQRKIFLEQDLSNIQNNHGIVHFKAPEEYDHCPKIGYCHVKNTKVFHILRTNKEIIYDTSYDFDQYRRRITPLPKGQKPEKHLITSGCSFSFGTGLKAKETLPYFLAQQLPDTRPYNYGLAGSGTNSMTAQTEQFVDNKKVIEDKGYMIYSLLEFHVPRSNALSMEREWLWDTPVYEEQKGVFKNQGTFKKVQPLTTWFYHTMQTSFKWFGLKLNFPPLRKKHYEYTCQLISKARQSYKTNFPNGRFLVYDHPFDEIHSNLKSCLKKEHIEVISSNLVKQRGDYIKYDGHPSAQLNRKIAKEISSYLKTKHSLDSF